MPKKTNKAFDWAKHCAKSNGTSHMMPDKFRKEADAFIAEAEALTVLKKEIVKREAEFEVMRTNFWHNVRKHLEATGVKDVFENSIDFDADAKKDGFLVVNFYKERQGPPMGRPMQM